MKIRIEVSSLASRHISGIGYYTERLANALAENPDNTVYASYFNFLGRQVRPVLNKRVILEENSLFPLRVYAKLQSHRLAVPFDTAKKSVDLTILPNYAQWPTIRSKYVATFIPDLTFMHYPELMEKNNLPHLLRVTPRAVKKSDFIITDSESVKSELVKAFGIPPEKIVVTPIPPSDNFFKKNASDVHRIYSIPTKKYILSLGTLEPRKNLPVLIHAYEKLPDAIQKEYSLVIAGGNGWKSEPTIEAIETAQKSGLSVVRIGYVDEKYKAALYQKASVYAMPSIYEGFGMPILESLASGIPVIASDIPVLREAGGKGALYFEVNNTAALTNSLVTLLTDPNLQKKLVQDGQRHLHSFSWQKNAEVITGAVTRLQSKPRHI